MQFRIQQIMAMEGDALQINLQGIPTKPTTGQPLPASNIIIYAHAADVRDLRPGATYTVKLTETK